MAHQVDGVLGRGVDSTTRGTARHGSIRRRAALPHDAYDIALCLGRELHFVDDAAQQLLHVPVGRRRRGPDGCEVGAQSSHSAELVGAQFVRAQLCSLRLGAHRFELVEARIPPSLPGGARRISPSLDAQV
jgi:hypothetical protein